MTACYLLPIEFTMPRSRNTKSTDYPYHVVARTNDQLPFPCSLREAWNIYSDALWFYSHACRVRVLAFVMMKNHFHLIISTPEGNLSDFMKLFMKKTSDEIRNLSMQKNHLYGARYYPSLIQHEHYYRCVMKYVYQNPVRARVCKSVLDYPFSTITTLLGQQKNNIPVYDDFGLLDNLESSIKWLNQNWNQTAAEQIKKGLRVQTFKPGPTKGGYLDPELYIEENVH